MKLIGPSQGASLSFLAHPGTVGLSRANGVLPKVQ
jgi:hypothetical protein